MKTTTILRALLALSLAFAACDQPGDGSSPSAADSGTASTDTPSTDTATAPDVLSTDTATAPDVLSTDTATAPDAPPIPDVWTAPDAPVSGGMCPPSGPFGTKTGDILPDVTVYDCDGNPRQLAELCANDASLVVTWAGWCNACTKYAELLANDIHSTITKGSHAVEGLLVITEKANGSPPDAAYCAEVRDGYKLTMPVYYEPTGAIEASWDVSTNSQEVILERGMKLHWKNGSGGSWSHPDSVNRVTNLLKSL